MTARGWRLIVFGMAALSGMGCGGPQPSPSSSDETQVGADWQTGASSMPVTLPDGFVVQAELKTTPEDRARGMMFRPTIPEGRGMLFIFPTMERQSFWMYNTLVALDIIWLDDNKQVVEISSDTPPCRSVDARACPSYGGTNPSVYVLELGAGQAVKHGVRVGSTLEF